MTISISDLSPVTSESLLASVDQEEGGVIKSAVARAIAARKVVGGLTKSTDPVELVIDCEEKDPVTVGKIAYPPIIAGMIAPCPPPITVGLIAIDPKLETI